MRCFVIAKGSAMTKLYVDIKSSMDPHVQTADWRQHER